MCLGLKSNQMMHVIKMQKQNHFVYKSSMKGEPYNEMNVVQDCPHVV